MVLSVCYLFYNPETVVFSMRVLGVLLMISSVFPIYLIAKEVLKSKFKAILVAFVSLLIPEFTATYFVVQEVLFYPVFLWCVYLVYLKFTREKNKLREVITICLFALLFFIKSYAIIFAVSYFGALVLIELKNKNYKKFIQYVLQGITCLVLVIARNSFT
jgi:hypothetical protein